MNTGKRKTKALNTLGNAYLYLREQYATTPWSTTEGAGLLDAAQILRTAFADIKMDFALLDFTEKG